MQPQNERKKRFLNSSFVCFAWELENEHFLPYSLHSHSVLKGLPATVVFFVLAGRDGVDLQKGNVDGGGHSSFLVRRSSA